MLNLKKECKFGAKLKVFQSVNENAETLSGIWAKLGIRAEYYF